MCGREGEERDVGDNFFGVCVGEAAKREGEKGGRRDSERERGSPPRDPHTDKHTPTELDRGQRDKRALLVVVVGVWFCVEGTV